MRFWRRNVPAEPTHDTEVPASQTAADKATELTLPRPEAEADETAPTPQPAPEPEAERSEGAPVASQPTANTSAIESGERQPWFWQHRVPFEAAPPDEEPDLPPSSGETGLHRPQHEPHIEDAVALAPSEPAVPVPSGPATPTLPPERPTPWGWLRRRLPEESRPEEKSPIVGEPAVPPLEETELRSPEPAPAVEEAAPPVPEIPDTPPPPVEIEAIPALPERWGWLRWRQIPEEPLPEQPPPAVEEPPSQPLEETELRRPEPAPGVEEMAPPAPEIPDTPTPMQPEPAAPSESTERRGWFARLRAGLSRSSVRLNDGINTIFLRRRLDDEALEELEELLISSDMGVGVAGEVTESLRRTRFNQEVAPEEVRAALAEQVIRLIEPVMRPLRIDRRRKPFVILVIGVNGSGKTTTIAKLAKQYRDQGMRVVLAAGDTFRAAAVEQLQIWGERTGCAVVTRPAGSDAAGLAYDALVQAQHEDADILLIDTAGRLQNKADLMGELQKIVRVLKKVDPDAPHSVLLVLDATTGQNAHAQAEIFRDMVGVTGIVMTKLDGTARGGVLVSLAEKYGIP
ncbi:MAG: signal recognition particle-docking protein FtsY, partial [Alphaproteobacteria bacterium]|nr:signal recognition particle-docking protein FtsY [Alphaproteobacteria bacterium]